MIQQQRYGMASLTELFAGSMLKMVARGYRFAMNVFILGWISKADEIPVSTL